MEVNISRILPNFIKKIKNVLPEADSVVYCRIYALLNMILSARYRKILSIENITKEAKRRKIQDPVDGAFGY
ncbi:MAG TPA: hypothetical protein ENI15_01170 [Spirochaetes bacterium]|nr:hypothetical protein [Spirochaetota bacterium]